MSSLLLEGGQNGQNEKPSYKSVHESESPTVLVLFVSFFYQYRDRIYYKNLNFVAFQMRNESTRDHSSQVGECADDLFLMEVPLEPEKLLRIDALSGINLAL